MNSGEEGVKGLKKEEAMGGADSGDFARATTISERGEGFSVCLCGFLFVGVKANVSHCEGNSLILNYSRLHPLKN